jgi:competence ComEA-like helix-hairpin-helix protein
MKYLKSHFWYNRSQRNGVLFLVFIIVILQLTYFFVDFSSNDKVEINSNKIAQFQKEIDSFKKIETENRKPKIYPFNPSFLTDYRGYQLGMSTEEIDRLLQHRNEGKYINSAQEFQQVTKINDSLLKTMQPYFKFPDWVVNKNAKALKKQRVNEENLPKQDLNSATAQELTSVNGIGEKLSQRIINYRNKLGGFLLNDQLFEVWYLDKDVAERVLQRFTVIDKPIIEKINVNTATFKEVLSIVYIDYELTKKIFNYRDEVAELQSIDELKKIDEFPIEKFERIALYLEAK